MKRIIKAIIDWAYDYDDMTEDTPTLAEQIESTVDRPTYRCRAKPPSLPDGDIHHIHQYLTPKEMDEWKEMGYMVSITSVCMFPDKAHLEVTHVESN